MKRMFLRLWRLLFCFWLVVTSLGCAAPLSLEGLHRLNPAAITAQACSRPKNVEPDAVYWAHDSDSNIWVSDRDPEALERFVPKAEAIFEYHACEQPVDRGKPPQETIVVSDELRAKLTEILSHDCEASETSEQTTPRRNGAFLGQLILGPSNTFPNDKQVENIRRALLGGMTAKPFAPHITPAENPEPEARLADHPVAQFTGGLTAGAAIGVVPGGSLVADAAIEDGVLGKGTRIACVGKAIGEIGSGIGQIVLGCGGIEGGGALTATGGGALVGIPVLVTSVGLVANGAVTFCNGAKNLTLVLLREEEASSQPPPASQPPKSPPSPPPAETPPPAAKPAVTAAPPPPAAPTPNTTTTTTTTRVKTPNGTQTTTTTTRVQNGTRTITTTTVLTTGQWHHAISKNVYEALQKHPLLKGLYKYRDDRFVTQAVNKQVHNGYQKWHIDLDDKIARWIDANQTAGPKEFEDYLRKKYAEPMLKAIFPNGL
jgi:hypothetical protein